MKKKRMVMRAENLGLWQRYISLPGLTHVEISCDNNRPLCCHPVVAALPWLCKLKHKVIRNLIVSPPIHVRSFPLSAETQEKQKRDRGPGQARIATSPQQPTDGGRRQAAIKITTHGRSEHLAALKL